jgi:regulator of RNase E activity RraB
VNFSDPLYTVELEHLHHEDIHSMTRFTVDGKVYYWNGHAELVKVETGDVIASFYPSWLAIDVQEHKLGKLVIKEEKGLDGCSSDYCTRCTREVG